MNLDEIIQQRLNNLKQITSSEIIPFQGINKNDLPIDGGIYLISNEGDKSTVYVVETSNLRRRIYQNLLGNKSKHTLKRKMLEEKFVTDVNGLKKYLSENCRIQLYILNDEHSRKLNEHFLISILDPKWND